MTGAMLSGFGMIGLAIIAATMGLWIFTAACTAAAVHFFILARHITILRDGLREMGVKVGNL